MKKRKSIIVKLTAALVFIVCIFSIVASPMSIAYKAQASSKPTDSKVQSYEERIAQLKKDQKAYEQQIKEAKASAASYQKQKEYLDKQIAAISEEIQLSNDLIIEYNNALIEKENEIANKQTEYDTRMQNFKARLRTSYEEGSMGYLTMLFSSKSLSGFLTSIERMTNMLNYDKRMMKELNDQKAYLTESKDALEKIKADQQAVLASLQESEKTLEEKLAEVQKLYDDTKKNQQEREKMLAEAKKAEEKATKELDAYLEELAKKHSGVYEGGAFSWPLPKSENKITSKYGWRTYNIWGTTVTDYHRGIDISCVTGTPVYAAASGKVEISGWNDSYGYYVLINHGSGYTTLYAHNSQLLVKQGQWVDRGTMISKSGSTGNSSGPHLHLEISLNGKLLNPLEGGILSHPALKYYC